MGRRAAAADPGGDGSWPGQDLAEVVPLVTGGVARPGPPPSHTLPTYLSSFVGRTREVNEVAALLGSTRLVTLTGGGGMGKTRLGVQVAALVAPGRAFFVNLAPMKEAGHLEHEVASAFALTEVSGRSVAEVLAGELDDDALLVLDNCEHLVSICADLVHRLLGACCPLRVLATSQQRLGVPGEVVWSVPALGVPAGVPHLESEAALDSAAVQLFCERAAAVNHRFTPSPANLEPIAEICRRLDGNPLAIELAAARVDVLSPADIAARLEHRFELLRGRRSAGSARHQTLTAALRWSDELLDEPERVLLRRLSVFAGGFSLDAAERVCVGGEVDRHRVLDLLSALVATSLVAADTTGRTARYRLLETVRYYAADGLTATGDTNESSERHAAWCVELVEEGTEIEDEAVRLAVMDLEQDNVRAALEWSLTHERTEVALRLAGGQMRYWQGSGRFTEAREWLTRVLDASGSAPAALRAAARHDVGFASLMLGDFRAARDHLHHGVSLWAEVGDPAAGERTQGLLTFVSTFGDGPVSVEDLERNLDEVRATGDVARLAEALVACGHARLFRGEVVVAHWHFEELVEVTRRSGDDTLLATGLVGLGSAALGRGVYEAAEAHLQAGVALAAGSAASHIRVVGMAWLAELARMRGNGKEARSRFEECLDRARALGAPYPLAKSLLGLGRALLGEGDIAGAQELFEETAELAGHAGLAHLLAVAFDELGQVSVARGDVHPARERFQEALSVARQCGDRGAAARSTYHLAELAHAEGDLAQAGSLHHEALSQRHQIGDRAGVVESLEALGGLSVVAGGDEMAARVLGAAQALRDTTGFPRARGQAERCETDLALLEGRMEPELWERAWRQGLALPYEEAVAYVSRGRGARARPDEGPESLTPTERDVVALVTGGLTTPEMAERLFVSPRTVQSHLRNVYAKLGVTSRRQLRQVVSGGT